MNYKIIEDIESLEKFIEWLPELKDDEKFYLSLFARKKYCPELIKSNDKTQLKRFLAHKGNMLDKIKQLECEVGSYKLREQIAPQESLVLYISVNPRCMKKATYDLAKRCIDLVHTGKNYNVHAEALSCVQRSKSRTVFVDFDVDDKSVDLTLLSQVIPNNSYRVLETRGGYHILVDPNKVNDNKWHQKIRQLFPVDQVGDQLIPVAGCTQGGFTPKFI